MNARDFPGKANCITCIACVLFAPIRRPGAMLLFDLPRFSLPSVIWKFQFSYYRFLAIR